MECSHGIGERGGVGEERGLIKGGESIEGDGYKAAPCSRLLLRLDRIGFQTGS
jgi:hypothetical protein